MIGLEASADTTEDGVYLMAPDDISEEEIARVLRLLGIGAEQAIDPVTGRFVGPSDVPRQELVLSAVAAHPGITGPELAVALGITSGGYLYELVRTLVCEGDLEKRGPQLTRHGSRRRTRQAA